MAQLDMTRARVGQCQARAVMSQDPLDAQEAQRDAYVMGHWAQQMSEVLQVRAGTHTHTHTDALL